MVGFITGGPGCGGESSASRKSYARMVGTTQEIETPRRRSRPTAPIIFYDNDVSGVRHPHDDALVVAIKVSSFQMKRVLIDSGSSVDILFWSAFERMRYDADDLLPVKSSLVGFSGGVVQPEGMISLPVTIGNSPRSSTVTANFLVVRCASSYNVILDRPTLNALKAVISTYHLLLKFPTESGSGEIRGDQPLARQCYVSTLKGKTLNSSKTKVSEAMLVSRMAERENEELRPTPVEELLTVPLDTTRADRTVRIGADLTAEQREDPMGVLRANSDLFAWSSEDMPGVKRNIIEHRLNIDQSFKPTKQKRRNYALKDSEGHGGRSI
ncbi:hypothetical protein J5N97_003745 [Dioscorea zingiberensis]|uniref:Peptidase A2 domain-containing protein n=1 Tax=Dioscorea zingiberensis TaxID=325984 RepID=A0A9D5D6E2_9LILI|nr:hypothetical protein J5N97_003745 [Dioscorea zingiberensis]